MASDAELAASAVRHAQATSKSWDWYLAEIRKNPSYNYKSTEWYKAGRDLELTKGNDPSPVPPRPIPPQSDLSDAQRRMFLAQDPLDCLQAPSFMVPVCTADRGYAKYYTSAVIDQLKKRFKMVECWVDCRVTDGTPYSVALEMQQRFGLDGCWGQCESPQEFAHAYQSGSRRMVGNLSALREDQLARVASGEVHITAELYRNVQPWMTPDWKNANAGIGGNCIACYASSSENASYTPVSEYKGLGYYVSGRDSVYGVGLLPVDWSNL